MIDSGATTSAVIEPEATTLPAYNLEALKPPSDTFNFTSLVQCENNTQPLLYKPGTMAVCQLEKTPCPDHYVCSTNIDGYGSCCPQSESLWKTVSGACTAVSFSVSTLTIAGPPPATGTTPIQELYTRFVASVQECALACYRNYLCQLATSLMNPDDVSIHLTSLASTFRRRPPTRRAHARCTRATMTSARRRTARIRMWRKTRSRSSAPAAVSGAATFADTIFS